MTALGVLPWLSAIRTGWLRTGQMQDILALVGLLVETQGSMDLGAFRARWHLQRLSYTFNFTEAF